MKFVTRAAVLVVFLTVSIVGAQAQTPFATGLQLPSKIIFTPRGHLLVAENGSGPNAGRVSIVDRITGVRRTLISGLPAGINSAEGTPAPSGPSGLAVIGNTLYILIAEGDGVLGGPVAGTQMANPNPASPLLSSLIAVTLGSSIDDITGDLALTPADHATLKSGQPLVFRSGPDRFTFKLIADFDNYTIEPRGDFPANVRHSDPYGLAILGGFAYVADAGQNSIRKVNLTTGEISTLIGFVSVPNTTGVGGPFIEAVPDSIRLDGNRLLVTLLSGFPFAPNLSKVLSIDPATGVPTSLIEGLTTAIDVSPVATATTTQYVIAEHSTNLLASAPGRILLSSGSDKTTLATLDAPASIAVDPRTREIFVAQIFPGTITRIDARSSLPESQPSSILPVVTSVPGLFNSRFETSLQLSNPHPYAVSGVINIRSSSATKTLPYALGAFESRAYANLMASADATGSATADIVAAVGPAPVAIARIFDTSRSSAATGALIQQVSPDAALRTGDRAALVLAADPVTARTNVGIRTLSAGASLRLILYRSGGLALRIVDRTYTPNVLVQESVTSILGVPTESNDLIVIEVLSGSAIAYSATVNNSTQETSFTLATPVGN